MMRTRVLLTCSRVDAQRAAAVCLWNGQKIPTGLGLGIQMMVEAGGIEPPSENPTRQDLHAYPNL